ncbi:hypothetical protein [Streptomyces alkaliterrae]|uniref:Tat pathway signal sequence domain protein n=1 Tax=Streptomyces alkaliterrae TaxID=2213162 RepID=A0A5P0YTR0_9ACTN|nr:hypothetical protein [Streptomyces alkaliterrae]MBB1255732.1 hypothetical protein [Streptomyces alkaliterrae]MBB1261628.1 hypothetical protein [Streptomyces alkaliterrae]MQS03694.1 hypothetical protein [Streptomyces alkaliterrae]
MRKGTALLAAGISAAAVLTMGTSAQAVDVPSDYTGLDLADDVVVEDVAGERVTPEDEELVRAPEGLMPRSAAGSSAIGVFSYSHGGLTIKVPSGCFLTHSIKGSGKKVDRQIAGVDCVGPAALGARFCNTRLEFHYADTSGKTYKIKRGPLNNKCTTGTVPTYKIGAHTLPKYGKACAQLFVNGKRTAVQCHFITK